MTIVLTLTYYDPYVSGLTVCAGRIAEALRAKGHTVRVLCMRHTSTIPRKETIRGVEVIRAQPTIRMHKGFLSFDWIGQMYAEIKSADVVIVNAPQLEGWIAAVYARISGKRVITIYHCDLVLPSGIVNRIVQFGMNCATRIVCAFSHAIVTYTKDYATHSRLLQPFQRKVCSIYPPVPAPKVSRAVKKKLALRIGTHSLVVGIAARLAAEKGIEYVIDALSYLPKDTIIVVAGPIEPVGEGKYKKQIARRVTSHIKQIIFVGTLSQEEMGAFYSLIDVLVVSSVNSTEAFGLVQVEAMLMGIPVVATDLPGVRIPIRETHMGIIVPTRNSKAIAEAILTLVNTRQSYILAKRALERIFSYSKTIQAYENLLTEQV